MTIGHMLDALLSKLATVLGEVMDGTPFTWSSRFAEDPNSAAFVDWIGDQLEANGFERHGEETMYNGTTGCQIQSQIFISPIAYLKLKHMAEDKEHARSEGPVNNLTRQPLEGRNRDGGLRYGEMERDAGIAHGGADVTRDRLMISSDQAEVPVCSKCGRIAQMPKKPVDTSHILGATIHGDKPFCRNCLSYDTVAIVRMPYAMKVTLQEFEGASMVARLRFRE
jgi:DNA-directed RNA polymerase II subunit RPB2